MRVEPSAFADNDNDDDDIQPVCWPGQLCSAIVFAIMFGGLGFVLSGGEDRALLAVIGQVRDRRGL